MLRIRFHSAAALPPLGGGAPFLVQLVSSFPAMPSTLTTPAVSTSPHSLRLLCRFDVDRLRADLARLPASEFRPHFRTGLYEGDWSVLPLRSLGGVVDPARASYTSLDFEDLPVLALCPYVEEVLDYFRCPKLSVRFLRVPAGARVKEHRDHNLSLEDGTLRLHIPVTANPEMRFIVAGRRQRMAPGECWYHDFTQPHSLRNAGTNERVHLVLDCVVNDWLRAEVLRAAPAARVEAVSVG
jgi:hypothetical protein